MGSLNLVTGRLNTRRLADSYKDKAEASKLKCYIQRANPCLLYLLNLMFYLH